MNAKTQELVDTLLAISIVSKRLAKNLTKEALKHGSDDGTGKYAECAHCRAAEVHAADH